MGRLKIGGRECDLDVIIHGVEFGRILRALFPEKSLTASEFEAARNALSEVCVSARAQEFLTQLNASQAAMFAKVSDDAYRAMEQTCLRGLQESVTAPSDVTVMWPDDFTAIESSVLLCLQDESVLVRHPSPIRWVGTTGLCQSVAWYVSNKEMSFLLNISPGILNFKTDMRRSIAESLPVGMGQPMDVMILGGRADSNNVLVMSLYHLALLAKESGYEFNITYQATLGRNLSPFGLPLAQCSACDTEFMRMIAYAVLKEKMILAYKTLYPDAPIGRLHAALNIPHAEVMTAALNIPHAEVMTDVTPFSPDGIERLIRYLCHFSVVAQRRNSELVQELQRHFDMSAGQAVAQEAFTLLFRWALRSSSTMEIYRSQCAEAFYTPKFSAFVIDLTSKRISLLAPQTLGVARSWRNPLFSEPPTRAASFLRHIRIDQNSYRIFLPLRTIDRYWVDPEIRETVLAIARTASDQRAVSELTAMARLQQSYSPEDVHHEGYSRQIFEFCLHLSTATTVEPLALLKAAIFSHHDRSVMSLADLEGLTLAYMYLLLAGLSATVEVHRRSIPDNNVVDAVIASEPDIEQQISDRLSRIGRTVHYQIALAEEAHCVYVANAHLPAIRFFSTLPHHAAAAAGSGVAASI